MPGSFPNLQTGAVCQYPLVREFSFATEMVRFLDGSEQRYRAAAAPLHRWVVDLALLDDGEVATLKAFFENQKGRWGVFSFRDPVAGIVYPQCSFEDDSFPLRQIAEARSAGSLVIYEHA